MKINKILFLIAVSLIPIVVISFDNVKTNFIMENKETPTKIKILKDNKIEELDLEEYIIGVVSAEMPASFNIEALKAQAVASRSYALYKKENTNNTYDLTADINNQGYIDKDAMKEKWGIDYDYYYKRIKESVDSTKGEVMTYNNKIIEALYFSMSSGFTEDASTVFKEEVEYLKSVESIYDNESITNFKKSIDYNTNEIKTLLNLTCNKLDIKNIKRDTSNYITNIDICNKSFKGTEIRNTLKLRSANFVIIPNGDITTITTYGYGHGVGMSQYGANGYANNGLDYKSILKHYYKNIEIKNINNV